MPKQYSKAVDYEKKLAVVMERLGVTTYNSEDFQQLVQAKENCLAYLKQGGDTLE